MFGGSDADRRRDRGTSWKWRAGDHAGYGELYDFVACSLFTEGKHRFHLGRFPNTLLNTFHPLTT